MKQIAGSVQQDVAAPDFDAGEREAGAAQSHHQVVVGDIPLEPPGFQPRVGVLARLDRTGDRATLIHTTTGLQGRGATQLAAAYARMKLAAGWRLVAWVNAGNTGSLLAGLATVAEALGLSAGGSRRDAIAAGRMLRHWLETDGDNCLLVFDDAEDSDALREFVPDGAARVLITRTRLPSANPQAGLSVDVFSADEALAFLAGPTGLDNAGRAAAVAAELGHLPLALAQAAAVTAAGQRARLPGDMQQFAANPGRRQYRDDLQHPGGHACPVGGPDRLQRQQHRRHGAVRGRLPVLLGQVLLSR